MHAINVAHKRSTRGVVKTPGTVAVRRQGMIPKSLRTKPKDEAANRAARPDIQNSPIRPTRPT